MCHGARMAEQDFCWLVSRLGSPLYLERFLTHGVGALPDHLRRRTRGLVCWQGVSQLGQSLGRYVHQPSGLPAYFFGQSSGMIRFAAELLFSHTARVLVTDLCWPPYLNLLRQVAKEREKEVCVVRIKEKVASDLATSDDVIEELVRAYRVSGCSGLFLSDISYLGATLPVERLATELSPDFVVIDGAQAFHQRHVDLSQSYCDLYLAGTQKWFGAYHPLRIAFVGREHNLSAIRTWEQTRPAIDLCDGMFRFHEEVKTSNYPPFGTTVNVSPLICAAGALKQAERQHHQAHHHWQVLRANSDSFADWVADNQWRPVWMHRSLRSGIVQVESVTDLPQQARDRIRGALAERRVVATVYDNGTLRFSMPRSYLSFQHLSEVSRALLQLSSELLRSKSSPRFQPTSSIRAPLPAIGSHEARNRRC